MIRLVYLSFATVPFTQADLDDLLRTSRRNNARSGVTGMLLFRDGDFLQVLEGEEAPVRETFDRIEQDPRHDGVRVIDESSVAQREFNDWAMGFRRLGDDDAPGGFVDFLRGSDQPGPGARAMRFLTGFRDLGR